MSAEADVKLNDFKGLFSLEGKVAVVTGGSRGLGLHAASGLAQAGCSKIFITSRKAKACEEAVAALNALPGNCKAFSVPADIAKPGEVERLVKEVEKHTDKVDILFANAGATWGAAFDEHPEDGFQKVMDLNVKSVFVCSQKFAPLLRKASKPDSPSRIIITASIAGIGVGTLGKQATFGYSASKAAALHLGRFFPTKMANGLMEMSGGVEKLAAASPNKRLGTPEDIAAGVVYLCSRAGSHINGGTLVLDGGSVLQAKL
ncbi:unnamed protein product [Zymoseptoria tritici ST99CH_3D1]|nr:unnamed protein product [Zymoseptoria tritici ST99CH_3D1]